MNGPRTCVVLFETTELDFKISSTQPLTLNETLATELFDVSKIFN